MKRSYSTYLLQAVIPLLLALVAWGAQPVAAAEVDNRIYADLLGKYVRHGGVDYQGLKAEEARLDQYLRILESVDSSGLPRPEQFSFYINAYNSWTIKLVLSRYPGLQSIKELGSLFRSPWKKRIAPIDGQVLSLDNIEHDILRPRFKDARIHFAVNCASKGCPPLRAEPYRGEVLEQQLTEMTTAFVNDPGRNYLRGDTLHVSSIFKWYREDFPAGPVAFVRRYARGALLEGLQQKSHGRIKVKYLPYDWTLNDLRE